MSKRKTKHVITKRVDGGKLALNTKTMKHWWLDGFTNDDYNQLAYNGAGVTGMTIKEFNLYIGTRIF